MDETHDARPGRDHERRDVRLRPVVLFGAGLLIAVVVVYVLLGWLFNYYAARQVRSDVPPSPLAGTQQLPPEPRLQVSATRDWQEMRAAEEAVLNSYGWVDREAEIVRIPIDRAMELLARRSAERGAQQ